MFTTYQKHTVEIESAFQPETDAKCPLCLKGAGTSPPEDVGGSMGYEEFLRTINDPEESEHGHHLEWCGGWFAPEAFDLDVVNMTLARME